MIKPRQRLPSLLIDETLSQSQRVADLEGLLLELQQEKRQMIPDTYEILRLKQEINNKMIRWGINDPAEFGATQDEIDL